MSLSDEAIDAMVRERVQPIVAHYEVEFDALAWLNSRPDVRDELRHQEYVSDGLRLLQRHLAPLLKEMQRTKKAA